MAFLHYPHFSDERSVLSGWFKQSLVGTTDLYTWTAYQPQMGEAIMPPSWYSVLLFTPLHPPLGISVFYNDVTNIASDTSMIYCQHKYNKSTMQRKENKV